jgi:CRP-like cAMP-binding protein
MAKAALKKSARKPQPVTSNGHAVQNSILLDLPDHECSMMLARLEFVQLPTHTILNEAGEPIKFAYFLNGGLASVLNVMSTGRSVEVGLCGKEGFVGVPLLAGFVSSPARIVMQVGGSGFRLIAKLLAAVLQDCPTLATALQQFGQDLAFQGTQVAACNRLHDVEQRLARWLLMSHDRLGGDLIPLTQEFLAHMLASRRASVTVAAGRLQRAGLITYSRGQVRIENRSGLEDACCECYATMTQQTKRWQREIS